MPQLIKISAFGSTVRPSVAFSLQSGVAFCAPQICPSVVQWDTHCVNKTTALLSLILILFYLVDVSTLVKQHRAL
jgi:hypothetical protein